MLRTCALRYINPGIFTAHASAYPRWERRARVVGGWCIYLRRRKRGHGGESLTPLFFTPCVYAERTRTRATRCVRVLTFRSLDIIVHFVGYSHLSDEMRTHSRRRVACHWTGGRNVFQHPRAAAFAGWAPGLYFSSVTLLHPTPNSWPLPPLPPPFGDANCANS